MTDKPNFFYNIALEHYKLSREIYKNLDNKLKEFLQIIFALFPILSGLGYYFIGSFSLLSFTTFTLALLFLLVSAFIGFFGYYPREFGILNPKGFYDDHCSEKYDEILEKAAVTIGSYVPEIGKNIVEKSKHLKYMIFFFIISNLFLLFSLISLYLKW